MALRINRGDNTNLMKMVTLHLNLFFKARKYNSKWLLFKFQKVQKDINSQKLTYLLIGSIEAQILQSELIIYHV